MAESLQVRVSDRETTGGGASRALRRQGLIPGVLYGENAESVSLSVDPRDIVKGLNTPGFFTTIFDVQVGGKKERALVKDVQFHPVTDAPVHVDFLRVGKNSKVKVFIPIAFENKAKCPGLKQGGTLSPAMRGLEVVCTSDAIPHRLEVDLADKEVNARMTTNDINLPEGVRLADPRQAGNTVANIMPPKVRRGAAAASE